ncbi:MAG TPA: hypothetical protein VJ864_06575 [Candidatus Binatia bacterium]|nr:hypothetical protein [Candidatus Binatia bacterium]
MTLLNMLFMSLLHPGDVGLQGLLIFLLFVIFLIVLPVFLVGFIIYKVFSKK